MEMAEKCIFPQGLQDTEGQTMLEKTENRICDVIIMLLKEIFKFQQNALKLNAELLCQYKLKVR
jgi:hypothetical protein